MLIFSTLMRTIFKVFTEFFTIAYFFFLHVLFFWAQRMWDFSSLTRDQIYTPCIGRQSLNYWTAREVPLSILISDFTVVA